MDYVIVSRYPAAVAFIREAAPEFASAPVVESASAEDVRGKVVAGNLPLHLAALAVQVVAVEFAGVPPRGQEYGVAEMRTAGARLARYTVATVPEPQPEISYSDGIGHRGRRSKLLVGKGNAIVEFVGRGVPGLVGVKGSDYTKNGKWSHTTYKLVLASGAWSLVTSQSWEEGEYFHDCQNVGDAVKVLRAAGCAAPDSVCVEFLRGTYPKTCERLDKKEAELKSLT